MAIEVAKVILKHVQDASGLEERILAGQFSADDVVAVIGKTEGNGGVNDFTRILADNAFRAALAKHGKRSAEAIRGVPMVWSGGCDGVITPHATVFARNGKQGPTTKQRLVIGTAVSPKILPEDIGRPAMVEKVAEGVRLAMRDAGIDATSDVHYVQTKTPLLTIDAVRDAASRGHSVACEVHDSMGVSNGTTALGIAVALGEVSMPKSEQICKDLSLYSSVASCSSGVELDAAQIVLLGNAAGASSRSSTSESRPRASRRRSDATRTLACCAGSAASSPTWCRRACCTRPAYGVRTRGRASGRSTPRVRERTAASISCSRPRSSARSISPRRCSSPIPSSRIRGRRVLSRWTRSVTSASWSRSWWPTIDISPRTPRG